MALASPSFCVSPSVSCNALIFSSRRSGHQVEALPRISCNAEDTFCSQKERLPWGFVGASTRGSMVYEADAQVRDPVHGSVSAISSLQEQIAVLQIQLAVANADATSGMEQQCSNELSEVVVFKSDLFVVSFHFIGFVLAAGLHVMECRMSFFKR